MASQTTFPMIEKATATVYRYNGRRYLHKRSAYLAKACEILGAEHEAIPYDDGLVGVFCACALCDDRQNGYRQTRALAKQLAAEDREVQP
jgi:hypothetical protein